MMILKDLSVGPFANSEYVLIGFYSQCVEDLYLRNLMPYKNKYIKKLNINLIGEADKARFSATSIKIGVFYNLLSIGEVSLYFNFESYIKKNDYDKKLDILNKIQEGFELFCQQTDTSVLPFKNAYQKCLNQNLEDEYLYREAVSKNKIYKLKVFIKVDLHKLDVFGVFEDAKGNELSRRVFLTRSPEALYHNYLGDVVWSSETEVTLYGRSKEEYWKIEL